MDVTSIHSPVNFFRSEVKEYVGGAHGKHRFIHAKLGRI